LPELVSLFSRNALAEADISGLVGGMAVQGQIDRMVVLEDKVVIADFKTGLPPKELEDSAQIPPAYLRQMALYGALVSQIYPDREVECLLIWTQIMKVSSVPAQMRQEMLEQLVPVPEST
jgi:ATP-dependent helicase/nuclease subunit A